MFKKRVIQPIMSDLPEQRVTQSHPFMKIGLDYAGPFEIKASFLRTPTKLKVWIMVIVCMYTRSCHFEIVTALSTNAFLQAFERFRNRRGTVTDVYCDNGKAFRGSANLLDQQWKKLAKECQERHAINKIHFYFIPRHSPNFAGLAEAWVKSMKYFLK